jgi:hypothetical protein
MEIVAGGALRLAEKTAEMAENAASVDGPRTYGGRAILRAAKSAIEPNL